MFNYNTTDKLRKKLKILSKKDKNLALNFKKKILEIIYKDEETINTYKNLKNPMNKYKKIYLTANYILLFEINIKNKIIFFIDIIHKDKVYKNQKHKTI